MFPCVLKCQSMSEGIYTLIAHTKIWLENFNDSAMSQMGPGLASPIANRTVIHISKAPRTRQRSLIYKEKCWTDLEGHCVLPPPSSDESRCSGWTKLRKKAHTRSPFASRPVAGEIKLEGALRSQKDCWCTATPWTRRNEGPQRNEIKENWGAGKREEREKGSQHWENGSMPPMPLPRETRTNAILLWSAVSSSLYGYLRIHQWFKQ